MTTTGLKTGAVTKVTQANMEDKEEGTGEGREEHQGGVREAVLPRDKVTSKDSEIMMWECLKDLALVATRSLSLKEGKETAVVEGIHRNRSQRTRVEATGVEVRIIRRLVKVSSMAIRSVMANLSLNLIKGSVMQREEEPANRINEEGRFVEELQLHCNRLTSPMVIP